MEAAGSERATLLAHGRAAQMALLFAATHPERVDSLVLLNGFARLSRADDYPVGMPAAVQASVLEGDRRALGNRAMATLLGPSLASRPGVRDWYGRVERDAAGPGTALAKMRAILELDDRQVVPLVAAPTLVVQNQGDTLVRAGRAAARA